MTERAGLKLAVAGKGGVGKTTLAAWLGDYLARRGHTVWMVDADTALSLGQASGLPAESLPEALITRRDLVEERIRHGGGALLDLNPRVADLLDELYVTLPVPECGDKTTGEKRLLVMGALANAGGGCACDGNALLKAVLAHLILDRREWLVADMEAGVEHLGRGTVASVDALIVVAEPSFRALETASRISAMGLDLGLTRQVLVLNRATPEDLLRLPSGGELLPAGRLALPFVEELRNVQLLSPSVLDLGPEARELVDAAMAELLNLAGAELSSD